MKLDPVIDGCGAFLKWGYPSILSALFISWKILVKWMMTGGTTFQDTTKHVSTVDMFGDVEVFYNETSIVSYYASLELIDVKKTYEN